MKKGLVVCIVLLALLNSCSVFAYTIKGVIKGAADAKVYLLKPEGDGWKLFDSANITNGSFVLEGTIGQPSMMRFQLGNYVYPLVSFALSDTVYQLNGTVHQQGRLIRPAITGGQLQQWWNTFQQQQSAIYEQRRLASFALMRLDKEQPKRADSIAFYQQQEMNAYRQGNAFTTESIRRHAGNILSSYLLYDHYHSFDFTTLQQLATQLGAAGRQDNFMALINNRLAIWAKVQPGQPAPEFKLLNKEGVQKKLQDFRGKYLVLDFWASWCGPCRKENPELVAFHHSLKKDELVFVGISIDEKKDAWLKAVEKDGLPWEQLIDQDGWKSEVAKQYAVGAVPQKFLIDPAGKIVLASTDLSELKKWYEDHFNK